MKIKKLTLQNFKGIRSLEVNFGEKLTSIYGENATGKTTIKDAFLWLLFGKDSEGRADFNVKTLDKNNEVIHKLEHSVFAEFDNFTCSRTLREKWTKKKGSPEAELTGNETSYTWDEVLCNEKEFKAKVSEIISEDVFRIITDPFYFNNEKQMPWQSRREMLISIAGGIDESSLTSTNSDFKELVEKLSNKSLEDYRKQLAAQRLKIKAELELIPSRVDEVSRTITINPDNIDNLQKKINAKKEEIISIDLSLQDESKKNQDLHKEKIELQNQIFAAKSEIAKIENQIIQEAQKSKFAKENSLKALADQVSQFEVEIKTLNDYINSKENLIKSNDAKMQILRDEFSQLVKEKKQLMESVFEMSEDMICPLCKQSLPEDQREQKTKELQENFNENKVRNIEKINSRQSAIQDEGVKFKDQNSVNLKAMEDYKKHIATAKESIEYNNSLIQSTVTATDEVVSFENPELTEKKLLFSKSIDELEAQINAYVAPVENAELNQKKTEINAEIDSLKADLSKVEANEKAELRISELEILSKKYAQEIADIEKIEYIAFEFTKAKIGLIEAKINALFQFTKFKMFNQLVNGGEERCCIALVDGVPFRDLNNAMKINCGLDIINTFCKLKEISAPIFVDNSESINELLATESQLIRLLVSNEKVLTIK